MQHLRALALLCVLPGAALAAPQYCGSGHLLTCPNPFGGFISNVAIGSLNNSSVCMPSPGYEDYTGLPAPTLPRLVAAPITVTVTGSVSTNRVIVFCDWNRNFIFDVDEFYVLAGGTSGVFTGVITPPSGAASSTRMRIVLHWQFPSSCGGGSEGNTEDYTVDTIAALTGVPATISAAAGGGHTLALDAGPAHAFQTYVIAGSASGTARGFRVGGLPVPLNLDPYTNLILTFANVAPFINTFGTLDASGQATATIALPPGLPGIAGLVLHHAFVVLDGSGRFVFSSEPEPLTILP